MIKFLTIPLSFFICCVLVFEIVNTQQSFCSTQHNSLRTYKDLLNEIPHQDYEALNQLFQYLIFNNYFAYTLFGNKPMTHKGTFLNGSISMKLNSDQIFLANWRVWKKYSSYPEFDTPNYVFKEQSLPELFEIHFINKKNVIECINQHIEIFKKILGSNMNAEKILNDMLTFDDMYDALGKSQILYGILFGFGKENATGYYQKFELELPISDPLPFHNEQQGHLNPLPLPYFSVFDSGEETTNLRKKYSLEREQILKIYSNGNFLEITLDQLTKIDPIL